MNSKLRIALLAAILCLASCSTPPSPSQARISEKYAETIALAQVGGGRIQSSELEREKGTLVWSFDISVPDSRNLREVLVDAQTGKVLSIETETPDQEAAEAAQDAKKRVR